MRYLVSRFGIHPIIYIFGAVGLVVTLVGAGAGGSSGVGIIDTAQITASSVAIQKAITDVSSEAQKVKVEFDRKGAELQAASEKYNRQQTVSSKEENERRLKEITRLKDELEEVQFRWNREVKKAQERMVAPMQERIMGAVREIASARRVSVVLTRENTVYFDHSIDLTKEVIARLNGK